MIVRVEGSSDSTGDITAHGNPNHGPCQGFLVDDRQVLLSLSLARIDSRLDGK